MSKRKREKTLDEMFAEEAEGLARYREWNATSWEERWSTDPARAFSDLAALVVELDAASGRDLGERVAKAMAMHTEEAELPRRPPSHRCPRCDGPGLWERRAFGRDWWSCVGVKCADWATPAE